MKSEAYKHLPVRTFRWDRNLTKCLMLLHEPGSCGWNSCVAIARRANTAPQSNLLSCEDILLVLMLLHNSAGLVTIQLPLSDYTLVRLLHALYNLLCNQLMLRLHNSTSMQGIATHCTVSCV